MSVSVWRTVNEHEHDESDEKDIGINAITKNQIDIVYQSGVKAPN